MDSKTTGQDVSRAERRAVCAAQDYLRLYGGDSHISASTSPKGDGRWVRLDEIFPRNAQGNAARQAIRRLHAKGRLMAWEIAYYGGCVKAVHYYKVAEVERAVAAMTPAEREAVAGE